LLQLLEVKQMGVLAKRKIHLAVPALFTSTSIVPHVSTACKCKICTCIFVRIEKEKNWCKK
jgi:hypothetical protein